MGDPPNAAKDSHAHGKEVSVARRAQSSLHLAAKRIATFLAAHRTLRLFLAVYAFATTWESLLRVLSRRRRGAKILSSPQLVSIESFRLAAFVASYRAVYNATLVKLGSATQLNAYLAPFLAALAAAPTMLLDSRASGRRTPIALYVATRAVQGVWDANVLNGNVPKRLVDGRWWFGGHILFAASNAILLHAFVYFPQAFPEAYGNFIMKYSTNYIPRRPLDYPADYSWPTPRDLVSGIAQASTAGVPWPSYISPVLHPASAPAAPPLLAPVLLETHLGHSNLTCAFLHPGDDKCSNVFTSFLATEFRRALPYFAAFSSLSLLIKPKSILRNPKGVLFRILISTLSSSAFLSLSISSAWSTICLFQRILPRKFLPTSRFYLQGFLAGLWVYLVDLPSSLPGYRATELGMYVSRMALQTGWDVANLRRMAKGRKQFGFRHGEVLLFGLGSAVLMALYEVDPKAIRSNAVRAALRRMASDTSVKTLPEQPKEKEPIQPQSSGLDRVVDIKD